MISAELLEYANNEFERFMVRRYGLDSFKITIPFDGPTVEGEKVVTTYSLFGPPKEKTYERIIECPRVDFVYRGKKYAFYVPVPLKVEKSQTSLGFVGIESLNQVMDVQETEKEIVRIVEDFIEQ